MLLRGRFSFFAAEATRVVEEEIRVVEGEDSGCCRGDIGGGGVVFRTCRFSVLVGHLNYYQ